MLYRVIVNNYKSFADEQQFDMFPNPKRENFPYHVLKNKQNIPVLKECAIYGANGAGKSNFINLLKFVKNFVTKEMSSSQELNNWYLPVKRYNFKVSIKPYICIIDNLIIY